MKLTLRMCFKTVEELRAALKSFSEENFESNACGIIDGVDFDYDFVDSNDLYSDDGDKTTITLKHGDEGGVKKPPACACLANDKTQLRSEAE